MDTGIEPYSQEWFIERQGSFTGSEVYKLMTEPREKAKKEAGLLSVTAETYILEKVWEKLSGQTKPGFDNMATEWGNENEPKAKKWYTRLTGHEITEANLIYDESIEGFTGTPDGLVGDEGMIEIKCPFNGANHLKHCCVVSDDGFRCDFPEYYYQIQSYLMLTGRKWCDFVSFDPRIDSKMGMFVYRVEADWSVHQDMKQKIKAARKVFNQFYEIFSKEEEKG
jgi:hypothetical protein